MGWLSPPESKKVGVDAFAEDSGLGVSMFGEMGDALYPEPSFANHVTEAFNRNELVYACIMEKATSLPEAPLRVYAGDGMGEPRNNHPLRALMDNPNPVLTEFELIELTAIHLDLAGNAFWEIVLDRMNRPIELWPLRPDRVRISPQRNGRHHYYYVTAKNRIVPLGEDVIHFKLPNAADPYVGQAPLRPALRAVALDNEASDFVKVLLQNRAVPGTVIETEQRLDEELATRLTDKWIQRFGKNRNGRPAFLQKGMKVHPVGLNLKDLEFPDLRTISETRICSVLGVPPILIGAKAGLDRSTFANYAEARTSFWEETLMPLQSRIQQTVAKKLLPYFQGQRSRRVTVKFDNSNVRALRESEGKRWELATQALRAGAITVNGFNHMVGLPRVEGGDVYLRPAGVIPTDAAGNPLTALSAGESGTESGDEDTGTGDESTGEASGLALTPEIKTVPQNARERFAKRIAKFAKAQGEAVLEDLEGTKGRYFLATKAWDAEKWNGELTAILEPEMKQIARRAARRVDRDADVEVMDPYIEAAAKNTAKRWNEATREEVAAAARETEWESAVAAVFATAATERAQTLASTTATDMDGFGSVDTAKRAGVSFKMWKVNSRNPRSAHALLAGETVRVGDTFSNGARWPGDSSLPTDERAGCQCSVEFTEGN